MHRDDALLSLPLRTCRNGSIIMLETRLPIITSVLDAGSKIVSRGLHPGHWFERIWVVLHGELTGNLTEYWDPSVNDQHSIKGKIPVLLVGLSYCSFDRSWPWQKNNLQKKY